MTTRPIARAILFALGCLLFASACVTINVYFPEAAVKDLSERIEDAVAREAAAQTTDTADDAPSISGDTPSEGTMSATTMSATTANDGLHLVRRTLGHTLGVLLALTAPSIDAQEVAAPEVTSPAIRRLIASRAQRVAAIDRFKAAGALGETNVALLATRDLQALALPDRAKAQKLVRDENADRERMFKEIAAATG
ncbi:MAG: DUF1318 domain-containing protein, partial [Acidobacteriota bacterium]